MYSIVDPDTTRDLRPEALDQHGRLRILPASFWASTTAAERALFGHRTGLYSFPTVELVECLATLIAGSRAIEIGAGNGVLAEALGIPATDSYQQRKRKYRQIYERSGQPIVPYGPNVIELDASMALRRYRPQVVLACWVTHVYNPLAPERGGNEAGVDERDLLRRCEAYVFVGNEKTHAQKPIWSQPHRVSHPSFVYSRANNGSRDFLAMFAGEGVSDRA